MLYGAIYGAALATHLQLFVPGRLYLVNSKVHWTEKALWASEWRERVRVAWWENGRATWDGPTTVVLTAYVAQPFNDEQLKACLRPIRGEAVRLILGTDDGRKAGHQFLYRQTSRPTYHGVLIEVAS